MSMQDYSYPDYDTVLAHQQRAQALRAQATRDGIAALTRGLRRLPARVVALFARAAHG
ncbi:MAG: hypothetical protein AAFR93_01360 [Pseudomonadota bacterium]